MTAHEPEFVAGTLAWCNEIRAEKGMEPIGRLPIGQRNNGYDCPCGAATGVFVGRVGWGREIDAESRQIVDEKPLPEPVTEFVNAFDRGELPQYDDRPLSEWSDGS